MAENLLANIFSGDAFTMVSLTDAVNKAPFVPGAVGKSGIFIENPVTTNKAVIEERAGVISLIQTSKRGGPGSTVGGNKRTARIFEIPHLERESEKIMADEIQGVRAFGEAAAMQTLETLVNDRQLQLVPDFDATLEFQRLGAIKGEIIDADLSVIYNLFDEFDVDQQVYEINLNKDIRNGAVAVTRMSEAELGMEIVQGYRAFCSDSFFDELVAADEVRDTFKNTTDAGVLRADLRKGFEFGGIVWENYRGKIGATEFIEDGAAYVCPVGTRIFTTKFAPADFLETANTPGRPRYSKMKLDPEGLNRWAAVHMQSNPLSLCLRPRAVIKVTLGTSYPSVSYADMVGRMQRVVIGAMKEAPTGDAPALTYTPPAGAAAPFDGIFFESYVFVDEGEAGVTSSGPAVFCRREALPSDPEQDDAPIVTVNGVTYSVKRVMPDGKGGLILALWIATGS